MAGQPRRSIHISTSHQRLVTGEKSLAGAVAVVAGATRGAGRGIARALGEAGATVYCTGRSPRKQHFAFNLCGRPGENRTRNASFPPRRRARYQRITELAPHPTRRAASLREQPESTKAKARWRRSSSRSAPPFGLGIGA